MCELMLKLNCSDFVITNDDYYTLSYSVAYGEVKTAEEISGKLFNTKKLITILSNIPNKINSPARATAFLRNIVRCWLFSLVRSKNCGNILMRGITQ